VRCCVPRWRKKPAVSDFALATRAARAGIERDIQHGAIVPPLHLSSNFSFVGYGQKRAYDYTRSGNPTRDLLAEALAELEQGAGAIITASGMAAITLLLETLPLGARVLAAHDCYGGTWRLLDAFARSGRLRVRCADLTDARTLAEGLAEQPALVWIETPSNPLLRITDIRHVAQAAHAVGAEVVVDNTFLSPALQQPLLLGADVVVHSTTKYINGHSDVVGGAVVARAPERVQQLTWWANCLGLTGAPFDSWLTLRGLRTLAPRMRAHQENATAVVDLLATHAAVSALYYPGLATHAGHALAARQQRGFGAMLSFELRGGEAAIGALLGGLRCFSLAESLGGVESLIAHPASMTHAAMAPEARCAAGIADGLLRLSIGIEDVADLLRDLGAGLARAEAATRVADARKVPA